MQSEHTEPHRNTRYRGPWARSNARSNYLMFPLWREGHVNSPWGMGAKLKPCYFQSRTVSENVTWALNLPVFLLHVYRENKI